MQVRVHIRPVNPEVYEVPEVCPYMEQPLNCINYTFSRGFEIPIMNKWKPNAIVFCCHRTFRVYPQGVSQAQ